MPQSVKNVVDSIHSASLHSTTSHIPHGGNPAFGIIIKNISYKEDGQKIIEILEEHGLVDQENKEQMEENLKYSQLIISQISEFSAIYLASKFRRFSADLHLGPMDAIHATSSYSNQDNRGLLTKHAQKDFKKSENIEGTPILPEEIITTTSEQLENYRIEHYIDVISSCMVIAEEKVADEKNGVTPLHNKLCNNLKDQAAKLYANAVVGVQFDLTPLTDNLYNLTATGNAVRIESRYE